VFVVVHGGVPGRSWCSQLCSHADVINDSSLMVRCSWWFPFLAVRVPGVRSSAAMQMSSMIVRSWFVVPGGSRSWPFLVVTL